jgi:hypothetical protein
LTRNPSAIKRSRRFAVDCGSSPNTVQIRNTGIG